MPKRIDGYQCVVCDKIHDTEEQAVKCEEHHKERMSSAEIIAYNFPQKRLSFGRSVENSGMVPTSVTVRFSDNHGDFGVYQLTHYGPKGL